jgi:hypothetical protein
VAGYAQSDRWGENWRVVSPPDSIRIRIGRRRRDRRAAADQVRRLAPGTPVVLVTKPPFARIRSRRVAAGGRVDVEREYLALPSADAPAYLVEDRRAAFGVFVEAMPVPPGAGVTSLLRSAALAVVRALRPRRVVAALAAGRVLVGRRL